MQIDVKVITDSPTLGSFYYWLRLKDSNGSGWLRFSLKEASEELGRSVKTIKRWMKQAIAKGFLQEQELLGDGFAYCKYVSRTKVCERTGGVVAKVTVGLESFKQPKTLRQLAYAASLLAQQERCELAVTRKNGTNGTYKPRKGAKSSRNVRGCDRISDLGYHFVKRCRTAIGAAQTTVAAQLSRSRSTIARNTRELERTRIYQGVRVADRPGCYYTFLKETIRKGWKGFKELLYRRAPNYYHSDLEVKLGSTQQIETPYKNWKENQDKQTRDKETIAYIITQKKTRVTDFSERLYTELTTDRARTLAHAILKHLKGKTTPKIDEMTAPGLVTLILGLKEAISQDEWALVQWMARRVLKGKSPLPYGIERGDLLIHLTQPATKTQLRNIASTRSSFEF
jgi:hypothetical protein